MKVLENLEPKRVFHFFEEMSVIPRGSGNTRAVSDWCADFARARGLEYHQDSDNNIIIIKEATPGYEQAEPMILQGHLDMVCEKEPDCSKDMAKEGLDLEVDGDFVSARGTTLGGDDGIAVAMALAVLDSNDLPHPRLEAVFTVDEEIGLLGAGSLDVSPLKGRRMLNMDSEAEGIFTVSCAGGNNTISLLPLTRAPFAGTALQVTVGGLTGGHSGNEIDKGRANANMLMGRVLQDLAGRTDLRLADVHGGLKSNAIPVESTATIVVADAAAARTGVAEMEETLRNEYHITAPALFLKVEDAAVADTPMDAATTGKAICLLTCLPNGIQAMSPSIEGLVQTSLNLGILTTEADTLRAVSSLRSSVDSQKEMLKRRLAALLAQLGGHVEYEGEYTGWQYQEHSPLRELMVQAAADLPVQPFNDIVGADTGPVLTGKIAVGQSLINAVLHLLSGLLQFHGTEFFYHGFGLFTGCFLALLGMDRLEHLGYQLYLGAWRNGEHIAVKVDGTPLVFGLRKHLSHGFQHTETLVANNKFHIVQTTATQPLEEADPAGLVLFHTFGGT